MLARVRVSSYRSFMSNRTAGAAVALLTAVLLTGCTGTATSAETPAAAAPAAKPTPSQTPAAPSPTPTVAAPTPTPWVDADGCAGKTDIIAGGPVTDGEEPNLTATWNGVEVIDRGPREHAMGKVTKGPDGRLAYTVAPGDGEIAISKRLCMNVYHLETFFGYQPLLWVGDVLKVPEGMEPNVPVPWKPHPMRY